MPLNIRQIAQSLGGDVSGHEVLCPGPGHSPTDRSLSVRLDPNAPDGFVTHSFAGDDPIVCRDYVREHAGLGEFKPQKGRGHSTPRSEATPVTPVTFDAPPPPKSHPQLGTPTRRWVYRDGAGRALLTVMRFDRPDGGKELRPLSLWRLPDGRLEWRWASLPAPRPLYRLDRLAESPDDPVIVCEGEKDADAAAGLFPDHVVVTSPSGAKSANKADWSPLAGRKVTIWPDADAAGAAYAADVVRLVQEQGGTVSVVDAARLAAIDPATGGQRAVSAGWGAADAVAEWSDHGALREAFMRLVPQADAALSERSKFALEPFDAITFSANEEWLLKGVLPKTGIGAIYGKPGSYKSFLALDLALAVATGADWGDKRVSQGAVVYVGAEGASGIRKRIEGVRRSRKLPAGVPLHLISAAPDLGSQQGDLEQLVAAINGARVNPGLIVIDTLSRTLNSADENGAGMVQFVANASELARRFGALVLVVHHSGLSDDSRMRGHSSLHGAMDATVLCERKEGELTALLTLQKVKDEAGDIALAAALERVVLGHDADGDEVSTLVVSSVREAEPQAIRRKGGGKTKLPKGWTLLHDVIAGAIEERGESIRPWADGPIMKGVCEDLVRQRYAARFAETTEPGEDHKKVASRRRQAFKRVVDAMIAEKHLSAHQRDGARFFTLNAPFERDSVTPLRGVVTSRHAYGHGPSVTNVKNVTPVTLVTADDDLGEELL